MENGVDPNFHHRDNALYKDVREGLGEGIGEVFSMLILVIQSFLGRSAPSTLYVILVMYAILQSCSIKN